MKGLVSRACSGLQLLSAVGLAGLVAMAQGGGSEELTPPMAFHGPPKLDVPPPPPPPQPVTAVRLRVAWQDAEAGRLVLRIHAQGTPGAPFLLGALRPGSARPRIVAASTLDADGRWSLEREIEARDLRALAALELVGITR